MCEGVETFGGGVLCNVGYPMRDAALLCNVSPDREQPRSFEALHIHGMS